MIYDEYTRAAFARMNERSAQTRDTIVLIEAARKVRDARMFKYIGSEPPWWRWIARADRRHRIEMAKYEPVCAWDIITAFNEADPEPPVHALERALAAVKP